MPRRSHRRTKKRISANKTHMRHRAPRSLPDRLSGEIISLLASSATPLPLPDIFQALELTRKDRSLLAKTLSDLVAAKRLKKKAKRYSLSEPTQFIRATLDQTSKGFGFAIPEEGAKGEKDIFIPASYLLGAVHGDTVLVAVTGKSRGRREGRIIKVISRATTRLCGIFSSSGKTGLVTPDNDKLPYTVLIRKGETLGAKDGTMVKVEITDFGGERRGPEGKITEIIGDPFDPSVQIRMAIFNAKLHDAFSKEVLQAAESLVPVTECSGDRKDLLNVEHVTIDGEDARDFDDAICVERHDKGYTLYVSIADVSAYVLPGSAIDREAYQRGTSVYLPDRVLPMLPERLSNNLCSLVPDTPRPAFTAILTFDLQGRRTGERYVKSLILSRQRFTYSTVNRILYLEDKEARQQHAKLLPMLTRAKELADLLNQRRRQRGSLGFNIPEAKILLKDGAVHSVILSQRNKAHQLIEECMLAANEAVAETLARSDRTVLYRIHENPDPLKLDAFKELCKSLGVTLPRKQMSPSWFAEVLETTADTNLEYVINTLLLRTMQQARYSPENSGHFGLAAEFYLHFTSPIRRYPDLVAHRALHAYLIRAQDEPKLLPKTQAGMSMVEAGTALSRCERKAVEVERDVHARLSCIYMKDKVGETFSAIISGVTSFGLFVELTDSYINGGIPVKTMTDDYYLHDAKRHRLIGERTNRLYQLGDPVSVQLDHVDILSKRITFSLVTEKERDDDRRETGQTT